MEKNIKWKSNLSFGFDDFGYIKRYFPTTICLEIKIIKNEEYSIDIGSVTGPVFSYPIGSPNISHDCLNRREFCLNLSKLQRCRNRRNGLVSPSSESRCSIVVAVLDPD